MHLHVTRRSKSRFAMMHRSAVWPHWQAASEQPCQTLFDVAPSINDGKYRDRAVSRDIESKVVLCLCLSEHTPIRKRRQNPVPQRKPFKPAYCFQNLPHCPCCSSWRAKLSGNVCLDRSQILKCIWRDLDGICRHSSSLSGSRQHAGCL